MFEDGILTDALGNTVDFKNAIIIMTSNIGARFIQKKGTLGFQANTDASREKMEEMVMSSVRQRLTPSSSIVSTRSSFLISCSMDELLEVVNYSSNRLTGR